MTRIVHAQTEEQIQQVIMLAQEYITWVIAAIHEQVADIDISDFIAEHDYDQISDKFPGEHVPPDGCLLLALDDQNRIGGCVALGKLEGPTCEVRTLFVRPAFRRQRMGKLLVEAVIQEAREIGYTHMRLDTLAFMNNALALYHSLSFRDIDPYREIPGTIGAYVRFLEIDLKT
jgi:GNAT superfamily N-acetyltransferase